MLNMAACRITIDQSESIGTAELVITPQGVHSAFGQGLDTAERIVFNH